MTEPNPITSIWSLSVVGQPASARRVLLACWGNALLLSRKKLWLAVLGINTGTIPSKTLRETALVLSGGRSRKLFGVDLSLRREATVADFMCHEKKVKVQQRTRSKVI